MATRGRSRGGKGRGGGLGTQQRRLFLGLAAAAAVFIAVLMVPPAPDSSSKHAGESKRQSAPELWWKQKRTERSNERRRFTCVARNIPQHVQVTPVSEEDDEVLVEQRFLRGEIPFSQVGDGVCDCCDGADEDTQACANTCQHVQAEVRNAAARIVQRHDRAMRVPRSSNEQVERSMLSFAKDLQEKQPVIGQMIQEAQHRMANDRSNENMRFMATVSKAVADMRRNARIAEGYFSKTEALFGEDGQFYDLLDRCFSIVSNEREYHSGSPNPVTYDFKFTLCPFRNATQIQVSGEGAGSADEVILGYFDTMLRRGDSYEMTLRGGSACWNGPERVVSVAFRCGSETKIADVAEDGKCIYSMVLRTPFACSSAARARAHAVQSSFSVA